MKLYLFSFILFFSVLTFTQAQNQQEQKAEELLNRYFELKRFNGTAVVAKNQKILFNKSYGLADYEHNIPIGENTKFCITGLTEQFTAYITFKVIQLHGLSLTTTVKDVLGEAKFKYADSITLHQLLSHTSGFSDFPLIHELPNKQFFSKEEVNDYIENTKLESEPGTITTYSKLNYNLIGLMMERVTSKPFEQLLKEYITNPIGMKNTLTDDYLGIVENRAKGYFRKDMVIGWENAPYLDPSNTVASQGILSTKEDLLLWNTYLKNNYLKDGALTAMMASKEGEFGYGLNVKRGDSGQINEIRSVGTYSSGFNSFSSINMDNDLIIIVLGNNRNPSSEDISDGLKAIFGNEDYTLPLQRKIVKVDPNSLQSLAGDYKINEDFIIKILIEGDKVFVNDGMRPQYEVFPQSETQFFVEGTDAEMVFIKNNEGEVTKIGLRNDGFTNAFAEKVSE